MVVVLVVLVVVVVVVVVVVAVVETAVVCAGCRGETTKKRRFFWGRSAARFLKAEIVRAFFMAGAATSRPTRLPVQELVHRLRQLPCRLPCRQPWSARPRA